ncbi:hypothetical protein B0T17DRAFT_490186 [Bombardia bombarda]|uniref:Uncharacterized protein n=1 Tax=Bombardia bombarda TaxID=252184 RepID=A0AA39X6Z3_9PEZI|nr:hypothetical protein B0T17DRAFT_490186 [Bombardia bombarda]
MQQLPEGVPPLPTSNTLLSSHSSSKGATTTNNHNNTNTNTIPSFAQGRPTFTHPSHPDQVATAQLPPAEPIAFDDNPDVLALKSAISILQLQRARATADMQALSRAKAAAVADPSAFVADLAAGRVGMGGDPLFPSSSNNNPDDDDDDDDDMDTSSSDSDGSSSGDEQDQEELEQGSAIGPETLPPRNENDKDGDTYMGDNSSASKSTPTQKGNENIPSSTKKRRKNKHHNNTQPSAATASWRTLPKPQTVVRCPPVNWAQYGVVGESLDKLHAEQVAAPTLGVPATLGPGAKYQFKANGATAPRDHQNARLVGIAAPYTPGKDKIDRKNKGGGGRR